MVKRKRHAQTQKSKKAWGKKIHRLKGQTSTIKSKKSAAKVNKLTSKRKRAVPLSTGKVISIGDPKLIAQQNDEARKREAAKRIEQEKLYAAQKAREIGRGNPPKQPIEFHTELGEDEIHK